MYSRPVKTTPLLLYSVTADTFTLSNARWFYWSWRTPVWERVNFLNPSPPTCRPAKTGPFVILLCPTLLELQVQYSKFCIQVPSGQKQPWGLVRCRADWIAYLDVEGTMLRHAAKHCSELLHWGVKLLLKVCRRNIFSSVSHFLNSCEAPNAWKVYRLRPLNFNLYQGCYSSLQFIFTY